MRLIYSLSIAFYSFAISLAAFAGNKKAKHWIDGRKNWSTNLKNNLPKDSEVTWFHVASLGEYEQAVPLLEYVKQEQPQYFILLTFFSPSGYEVKKNNNLADYTSYLPADNFSNAINFIQLVKPKLVFFIKYEFWFNYLKVIQSQEIKCYLVSGIFRKDQHFFKFYGKWFKNHLSAFTHFFVQNEVSYKLLLKSGFDNVSITGDTRLDRVHEIAKSSFNEPKIEKFCSNKKVVVFGSSWEEENKIAIALSNQFPIVKIIVAPHVIDEKKIKDLKESFQGKAQILSQLSDESDNLNSQVLIIDKIGVLSKLYRFATFAMIGGGFGAGIHNTLEASIYGCPVVFGPNFHKFQEAIDLIDSEAGFTIDSEKAFLQIAYSLINNDDFLQKAKNNSSKYVNKNLGATQLIVSSLFDKTE